VTRLAERSDEEVLVAMRRAARTALIGGVTTVRDLGDRDYLSLALRGEAGMPHIVAAGPPITTNGGHCHFLGGVARPGVEGVRAAVRERLERGVDVIKIMASGGNLTPGSAQHQPQFSKEELQAAVDEAHRHGLPITAHAHATQGIINAASAGVDGIEHASFWSEEGVDDPAAVIQLLVASGVIVGASAGYVAVPGASPPPAVLKRMPMVIANMQRLHQAGVQMVAGTDAGIGPTKPHDVLRSAIPHMIQLGMSPAEVLRTITSVAAKACGLGSTKGRIAPGYDADILAIDGNPLTNPEAIHRIKAVYSVGHPISHQPH
jgi:imidazolonepropionase-like amidohydrolase